ncbi:MAG: DUF3221 domain-containing protein [Planctomycetes bacterium]|nr:DUF3221 domain-containing protein [Planctomycetota bacterium]
MKYVLLITLLSAGSFNKDNLKNDRYNCPQETIKDGFMCGQCMATFIGDDPQKCKTCNVTTIKVKVCKRIYYKAEDCIDCGEKLYLKGGRCCAGKGKELKKFEDLAPVLDICMICRQWAVPGSEIKHEQVALPSGTIQIAYKCNICKSVSGGLLEVKELNPDLRKRYCCGEECAVFKDSREINENVVIKSRCRSSGRFPHCSEIPPDIFGVIKKITRYKGQETDTGNKGTILVEFSDDDNRIFQYDKAFITITENSMVCEKPGCEHESGDMGILKEGQKIMVWFKGSVAESYPVQAVAREVLIAEEE